MQNKPIKLPGFLIADLYANVLVDIVENKFAGKGIGLQQNEVQPIRYLGQNLKRVLVIVRDETSAFINDPALAFLTKILNACHLNLSDIAIINLYSKQFTQEELAAEVSANHILLFDIKPTELNLPFNIPNFQVNVFDGCTFVTFPGLNVMMEESAESKILKSKMWVTLKKAFKLD